LTYQIQKTFISKDSSPRLHCQSLCYTEEQVLVGGGAANQNLLLLNLNKALSFRAHRGI